MLPERIGRSPWIRSRRFIGCLLLALLLTTVDVPH